MARVKASTGGSGNRTVVLLAVLILVAIVLAFASFLHNEYWLDINERLLLRAVEQQALVQQVTSDAVGAARADEAAFGRLQRATADFAAGLSVLKDGEPSEGLPVPPEEIKGLLRDVESSWLALREVTDELYASREAIFGVRDLAQATGALLPELQEAAQGVAAQMADKKLPQSAVLVAADQSVYLERMAAAIGNLLRGGAATVEAIDKGTTAAEQFAVNITALLEGDPDRDIVPVEDAQLREALQDLEVLYRAMRSGANDLVALMPKVTPSLDNVNRVVSDGARVNEDLDALIQAYRETPGRWKVGPLTVGPVSVMIFGALAAILLVLLGLQMLVDARRREAASKVQNEANERAILRLLDEMGDLADGDLTVEATVTEDVTGAIADSINYAVDALRGLVTTINETSEKVSRSAQSTRTNTMQLAEASEAQSKQIAQTSGSIKRLTAAIDEVAQNATESAEVASRSVEVAGLGAQTVRDTIQGMDTIREQIQETSKRIKRLGESSQEIGEIVELIDDIADQTNILALNAAMQAAMAGEAGRGFAVVADEVQRLAERSRNATKQIEGLVRTIQADTNEAVSSMEESTAGVVEGANLAENAGGALREIENVSNYIADLTQRIADSAQEQSAEAANINKVVGEIQDITKQTVVGTRTTAGAVEEFADLAVQLERTVAGFRLP